MQRHSFSAAVVLAVSAFIMAVSWQTANAGAAAALQAPAAGEPLPDAPGKAVVERVCTMCHGIDYVVPSERMVPVWRDMLDLMKAYGATASDEEWTAMTDYIMRNLAFLNINQAPAADIGLVFGVGEKIAMGVVAYRDKIGGFKTVDDLKKAPDVDAARVDALKPRLVFETN